MRNLMFKGIFTSIIAVTAVPTLVHAKEQPPANRVTMDAARKAAKSFFPGKVQGEELEFEGGKWIYSFDLTTTKDSKIHEVQVDAISGKVVSSHTESATDEKNEKQEDENEAK